MKRKVETITLDILVMNVGSPLTHEFLENISHFNRCFTI